MPVDRNREDACARRGPKTAAERAAAAPGGRASLVEPMLLCALAIRPAHGYELRHVIEELTEGLVTIELPSAYRLLRRLEDEGLARSSWRAGAKGPQRRIYTLTLEGRSLLEDWDGFLTREKRVCTLATASIQAVLNVWAVDPLRYPSAAVPLGEVEPAEHLAG